MGTRKAVEPAATVPALIAPVRADWSEWSAEHERKRLEYEIDLKKAYTEEPIYPRECAVKVATEAARQLVPDWNLVRDEQRGPFMKLVKQQPELQQKEIKQFEPLLRLIREQLPTHIAPLVADLRAIIELITLAHERSAFFVGVEAGRLLEHQHIDGRGRVKRSYRQPAAGGGDLRLHMEGGPR